MERAQPPLRLAYSQLISVVSNLPGKGSQGRREGRKVTFTTRRKPTALPCLCYECSREQVVSALPARAEDQQDVKEPREAQQRSQRLHRAKRVRQYAYRCNGKGA